MEAQRSNLRSSTGKRGCSPVRHTGEPILKILSINLSFRNYVIVESTLNNSTSTFLIDTGSDISIFKSTNTTVFDLNPNICFNLSGIGQGTISTLGNVTATLFFKNVEICHDFQIVGVIGVL